MRGGNLTGLEFGRWTVVSRVASRATSSGTKAMYTCRCACGQKRNVLAQALRSGNSKSCGCLKNEMAADLGRSQATHGHSREGGWSLTYKTWASMMNRVKCDPRYLALGIQVCERWKLFDNFLSDMGERLSVNLSIDRINNELGYEPGNCRWATIKEQSDNRRPRGTVLVTEPETAEHRKWRGEKIRAGIARKKN